MTASNKIKKSFKSKTWQPPRRASITRYFSCSLPMLTSFKYSRAKIICIDKQYYCHSLSVTYYLQILVLVGQFKSINCDSIIIMHKTDLSKRMVIFSAYQLIPFGKTDNTFKYALELPGAPGICKTLCFVLRNFYKDLNFSSTICEIKCTNIIIIFIL